MITRRILGLVLVLGGYLFAQEGHPMRGTWHGNWGPNAKDRTDITLVMDWDGAKVTGIANPGLRSAPIEKAALEPAAWKFHFESNLKDRTGTVTRLTVDAHLENVTNVHRVLVGTYTQVGSTGTVTGDFKAVRDN
jgi:hypothetical protein